jgi:hypothetical protein
MNRCPTISTGTLFSTPAKKPHFAGAKDPEAIVIIQATSIGPSGTVPIAQKVQ